MGARLTAGQSHLRVRPLLLAALAVVPLVVALGANSASAAKSANCTVTDTGTGRTFPRLQQAVDAAKPGARLIVKGTCHGGTFIDKDIDIVGQKTKPSGKAVLDGDNKARVVVIGPHVRVIIERLTVQDGNAERVPDGGGISNRGILTLRSVVVRRNRSLAGAGGIWNNNDIRIRGRSVVTENDGPTSVLNEGRFTLWNTSRVVNNSGVENSSVLILNGSATIEANSPFGRTGPALLNTGILRLNGSSSIHHQQGGGIDNSGRVTLNDRSSLHDNVDYFFGSVGRGGGVQNSGTLRMTGESSIHDNRVLAISGQAGQGGGVFNTGSLIMEGSSRIHGNGPSADAAALGGGVYNASGGILIGVTCGPAGNVYGNTPDDCYFEP